MLLSGEHEAAGALLAHAANVEVEELIFAMDRARALAIEHPRTRLPGRGAPKGTRGRPGFDALIDGLLLASLIGRCELTAGRDTATGKARGSLVDVVRMLQPCLPAGSVPSNDETLLKAIDRRRREWGAGKLIAAKKTRLIHFRQNRRILF